MATQTASASYHAKCLFVLTHEQNGILRKNIEPSILIGVKWINNYITFNFERLRIFEKKKPIYLLFKKNSWNSEDSNTHEKL